MRALQLRIISTRGELFHGAVSKISIPTPKGRITFLPGHVNLVTTMMAGELRYFIPKSDQSSLDEYMHKDNMLMVTGGLIMIENDVVTIAAEE